MIAVRHHLIAEIAQTAYFRGIPTPVGKRRLDSLDVSDN
jgi:hypothetical protein